ncbi:MAG TPA: hypothetical protein VMI06_06060 [Terriglobia bacterium]|nr:hypothetical protein [Terriglobia bacterium]
MSRQNVRSRQSIGRSLRRRQRKQLTQRLQSFVSTDEYDDIVAAAQKAGVSLSRWVAEVAVRESRRIVSRRL